MDINLFLQQQQHLSQAQIQSLGILSFDNIELNQFLREEYLENPLLDYSETFPNIAKSEAIKSYSNIFCSDNYNVNDISDITQTEETSIKQQLLSQLDIKRYSKHEWALIQYLIDCLDSNGFFTFSASEIASHIGVEVDVVENCLKTLRTLEPAGIFSNNLASYLIFQLDKASPDYSILKRLISCHLDNIASGKISTISRDLNLSTSETRKYIDRICLLNPRPLSGFSSNREKYIIPDIIITKDLDNWDISLNDNWIANYHLNDHYLKMLETTNDPELLAYFEEKLSHIQFIFSCIEQRRKTLLSIAEEIVQQQKSFFSSNGPLAPMTMTSIAEKLELHPSTLSRAIKGKYLQYPGGTILCKDLFNSAFSSAPADEESLSQSAVKEMIKKLILSENKRNPYSDQTLVKLLSKNNITISRRTVTKYRETLGIKSSVDRKNRNFDVNI